MLALVTAWPLGSCVIMGIPLKVSGPLLPHPENGAKAPPPKELHSGAEEHASRGRSHPLAIFGSDILGLPPFSPLDPTNNIVPNREEINTSVVGPALSPGTFFPS